MNRGQLEKAYVKCRANCRRSKNVGPFAGCKCQCGGYGHGSETLGSMKPRQRAAAAAEMRVAVAKGASMVEGRIDIAREIKQFHKLIERELGRTQRALQRRAS